ncbi:LOB domain-containing protein 30-like [Impatiens glandulifera]|uniref:LOB domain-containing protein 30-like n=1 Tax=Impatiens glandulifera TaxID=253017 RepID=UPI001FB14280|nr:LOB domain-containing protein 30-like [Impatiens glandulifera]
MPILKSLWEHVIIMGACGVCKFLQKRCLDDCIFAPYFHSVQGIANFESIHRNFRDNNICKLLTNMPIEKRADVVITLCLEARARLQDSIYGRTSEIYTIQNQVITVEIEFSSMQVIQILDHLSRQPIRTLLPPELRWTAAMGRVCSGVTP